MTRAFLCALQMPPRKRKKAAAAAETASAPAPSSVAAAGAPAPVSASAPSTAPEPSSVDGPPKVMSTARLEALLHESLKRTHVMYLSNYGQRPTGDENAYAASTLREPHYACLAPTPPPRPCLRNPPLPTLTLTAASCAYSVRSITNTALLRTWDRVRSDLRVLRSARRAPRLQALRAQLSQPAVRRSSPPPVPPPPPLQRRSWGLARRHEART